MTSRSPPGAGAPLGWPDGLPQNRRRDYCEYVPGRAGRAGGHGLLPVGWLSASMRAARLPEPYPYRVLGMHLSDLPCRPALQLPATESEEVPT